LSVATGQVIEMLVWVRVARFTLAGADGRDVSEHAAVETVSSASDEWLSAASPASTPTT
jgi:hypothetical protein